MCLSMNAPWFYFFTLKPPLYTPAVSLGLLRNESSTSEERPRGTPFCPTLETFYVLHEVSVV